MPCWPACLCGLLISRTAVGKIRNYSTDDVLLVYRFSFVADKWPTLPPIYLIGESACGEGGEKGWRVCMVG